ncbi:hypothetical protein F0562_003231 [Nyssa sinensis]|uniref:Uncharacterized protein n=1 Tax=Nyssa sinensis TaxID=561372 RepID=A0A5J5BYU8_9ASTE|nr:hypothetical protein F0562_003231 [Nyssa sinensis]
MSIEALAMAGADYRESGIELEALERCGLEQPPPYLLAEQNLKIEVEKKGADMLRRIVLAFASANKRKVTNAEC